MSRTELRCRYVWDIANTANNSSNNWSFCRQTHNRAERIYGSPEETEKTGSAAEGSATHNTEVTETESFASNFQKFHICDSETASCTKRRRLCCTSNVARSVGLNVHVANSLLIHLLYSVISIALAFNSQGSLHQAEPLIPCLSF